MAYRHMVNIDNIAPKAEDVQAVVLLDDVIYVAASRIVQAAAAASSCALVCHSRFALCPAMAIAS